MDAACADLVPPCTPPTGACCDWSDYTCRDDVIESNCQGAQEEWTEGLLCAALNPPCAPPPTGACCDWSVYACGDGVVEGDCQGVQLEWTEGVLCIDLNPPCVEPTGACCDWSTFVCQDEVVQGACQGAAEEWTEGLLCAGLDPPCSPPTGACCHWDTFTWQDDVEAADCQGAQAEWTEDVPCADLVPPCLPPMGACCFPDESCSVVTPEDCTALGGWYAGTGTDCSTVLVCDQGYRTNVLARILPILLPTMCDGLIALDQGDRCASLHPDLWVHIGDPEWWPWNGTGLVLTVYLDDGGPPLMLEMDYPDPYETQYLRASMNVNRDLEEEIVGIFPDDPWVQGYAIVSDVLKILQKAEKVIQGMETVEDGCWLRNLLRNFWCMFNQDEVGFCAIDVIAIGNCMFGAYEFCGGSGDSANIMKVTIYYSSWLICELLLDNLSDNYRWAIRQAIEWVRSQTWCYNPPGPCPPGC